MSLHFPNPPPAPPPSSPSSRQLFYKTGQMTPKQSTPPLPYCSVTYADSPKKRTSCTFSLFFPAFSDKLKMTALPNHVLMFSRAAAAPITCSFSSWECLISTLQKVAHEILPHCLSAWDSSTCDMWVVIM